MYGAPQPGNGGGIGPLFARMPMAMPPRPMMTAATAPTAMPQGAVGLEALYARMMSELGRGGATAGIARPTGQTVMPQNMAPNMRPPMGMPGQPSAQQQLDARQAALMAQAQAGQPQAQPESGKGGGLGTGQPQRAPHVMEGLMSTMGMKLPSHITDRLASQFKPKAK